MKEYALIFFPQRTLDEIVEWSSDAVIIERKITNKEMYVSYQVIQFHNEEDEVAFKLKFWQWL